MRVLVVTTINFPGIARLPRALHMAGCEVGVLCPPNSFIDASRFIAKRFHLSAPWIQRKLGLALRIQQQSGSRFLESFVDAVGIWRPTLIVPGDEPTVRFLHQIVSLQSSGPVQYVSDSIFDVITASLGDPAHYRELTNKRETAALARRLGVPAPRQYPVRSADGALRAARELSYPVVVKQPLGYAGTGVFICRGDQELVKAWRQATRLIGSHRRIENLIRRCRGDTLGLSWHPTGSAVDVQQFIPGVPGMHALVALRGKTLAGFSAVAERVDPPATGQSTVLRFVDHPGMARTASEIVAASGSSGFVGFDFIVAEQNGVGYLLECNPRPIPMTHLGSYLGVDLCKAWLAAVSGGAVPQSEASRIDATVAMFPQEWARDRSSRYLTRAYHDVPWDDPSLLRAYVAAFT